MARRPYGSGSVYSRPEKDGSESWYGRWYPSSGGGQVHRKIGPKRKPGSREGLTKAQAERELDRRVEADRPVIRSRLTIEALGARYIEHLEAMRDIKLSTLEDYRSMLRRHFRSFFGIQPIERIDSDQVRRYMAAKKKEGLATKTVTNQLNFLHGMLAFAVKEKWLVANAVASTDRPRVGGGDPDIRFLTLSELKAVLQALPDDHLGPMEHVLYVTAAMTGLRQGELLALRWRDVDWEARRIRVRRNYTRSRYGKPKFRRSSRSVPTNARVRKALKRREEETAYTATDDLVFAHPQTGNPFDASKLRKRFQAAVTSAGVGRFEIVVKRRKRERKPLTRFHDLRHTFGTHCAARGVPMRTLQEWMGHRSIKTTEIYADYAPNSHENDLLETVFEDDDPADGESSGEDSPHDGAAPQA